MKFTEWAELNKGNISRSGTFGNSTFCYSIICMLFLIMNGAAYRFEKHEVIITDKYEKEFDNPYNKNLWIAVGLGGAGGSRWGAGGAVADVQYITRTRLSFSSQFIYGIAKTNNDGRANFFYDVGGVFHMSDGLGDTPVKVRMKGINIFPFYKSTKSAAMVGKERSIIGLRGGVFSVDTRAAYVYSGISMSLLNYLRVRFTDLQRTVTAKDRGALFIDLVTTPFGDRDRDPKPVGWRLGANAFSSNISSYKNIFVNLEIGRKSKGWLGKFIVGIGF